MVIYWSQLTIRHVSHIFFLCSQLPQMNFNYYVDFTEHIPQKRVSGNFLLSGFNWYFHPQIKISLDKFSCSIKIKVKEDNISIFYNMLAYKSKLVHAEDNTLNFSPIRNNGSFCPMLYNNFCDYFDNVLPYYLCRCSTGLHMKDVLRINSIPTSTYSVLSSLRIGF